MEPTQKGNLDILSDLLLHTSGDARKDVSKLKKACKLLLEILYKMPIPEDQALLLRSRIDARLLIIQKKELLMDKFKVKEELETDVTKLRTIIIEMINFC